MPTPWVTGIIVPTFQKKALRLNEVLSNLPKVTQTVGAKDLNSVRQQTHALNHFCNKLISTELDTRRCSIK